MNTNQELARLKSENEQLHAQLDQLVAVSVEFINDWRKGNFTLPILAAVDATDIERALVNLKRVG